MGTIDNGILGGFNGKVGTVVGAKWKGLSVMRSRPPRKKGKLSEAQLQQNARFSLMMIFLVPLTDLLNATYKNFADNMSGYNKAFAVNVSGAITGVPPAISVDYTKVLLSKGRLPNGAAPSAASTVAGKLVFTWTDNSNIGGALATDIAFVAVYNADLNHWIYVEDAAPRNAGTYTIDASAISGKAAQTYIGFISASGTKVSNSLFTGAVTVL